MLLVGLENEAVSPPWERAPRCRFLSPQHATISGISVAPSIILRVLAAPSIRFQFAPGAVSVRALDRARSCRLLGPFCDALLLLFVGGGRLARVCFVFCRVSDERQSWRGPHPAFQQGGGPPVVDVDVDRGGVHAHGYSGKKRPPWLCSRYCWQPSRTYYCSSCFLFCFCL